MRGKSRKHQFINYLNNEHMYIFWCTYSTRVPFYFDFFLFWENSVKNAFMPVQLKRTVGVLFPCTFFLSSASLPRSFSCAFLDIKGSPFLWNFGCWRVDKITICGGPIRWQWRELMSVNKGERKKNCNCSFLFACLSSYFVIICNAT